MRNNMNLVSDIQGISIITLPKQKTVSPPLAAASLCVTHSSVNEDKRTKSPSVPKEAKNEFQVHMKGLN